MRNRLQEENERTRLQEENERTRGGRPPLGTPCSSCRSSATILSALHETFIGRDSKRAWAEPHRRERWQSG